MHALYIVSAPTCQQATDTCVWHSPSSEPPSAAMRPGIQGFPVPDELGHHTHTHLFLLGLGVPQTSRPVYLHGAEFLPPGPHAPAPSVPHKHTHGPISGFQVPTHLVRLTLPLAGALGIHPEVGVHVVGADASVGIADGRQGQASRGHPEQQQQHCHLPPAAPQGPHGAVCSSQRPPLRCHQGLGPTRAFSLSGAAGTCPCPPTGFLAAGKAAAASTKSVEPAGLCGFSEKKRLCKEPPWPERACRARRRSRGPSLGLCPGRHPSGSELT